MDTPVYSHAINSAITTAAIALYAHKLESHVAALHEHKRNFVQFQDQYTAQ